MIICVLSSLAFYANTHTHTFWNTLTYRHIASTYLAINLCSTRPIVWLFAFHFPPILFTDGFFYVQFRNFSATLVHKIQHRYQIHTHYTSHRVLVLVSLIEFFLFLFLHLDCSRKPHMVHSTQLPDIKHTQTATTIDDGRRRANHVKWDHLSIHGFFSSSFQFSLRAMEMVLTKSRWNVCEQPMIFAAKMWIEKQR